MEPVPVTQTTRRALAVLRNHDRDGVDCFSFGHAMWPDRTGRIASGGGGGDYAAQMLLGRLRKLGYAQTLVTEGSSRWALTLKGRAALGRKP